MKRIITILAGIIITTLLVGCSSEIVDSRLSLYNSKKKQINDKNSYNYIHKKHSKVGSINQIEFEQFIGMDTIHSFNIDDKEERVTIKYNMDLQDGDFKIVVVEKDKSIVKEINMDKITENKGNLKITLKKGKYRIKILGKDARGKCEYEIIKEKLGKENERINKIKGI